ncbi:hypothetical protein A8F94_01370 [Bacillus sp. FJAT-27225]|uniref:hypothetical protein n=1 Tax=Bacillus sp. FJAT-27225 TaxID=1743144 RepID=UPI00080C2347|nr:hypothetical protein [Bacillus sp. FJAT-27225]OCA90560.1 hypothetical protein A8F94_01370 [Bacillus sp. FJAT-27225]
MYYLVVMLLSMIVAGFSLLHVKLTGPIFYPIHSIIHFIAVLAILIAALYLIFLAIKAIFRKK